MGVVEQPEQGPSGPKHVGMDLDRPAGEVVTAWREERRLSPSQLAELVSAVVGRSVPVVRAYLSKLDHNRIDNPRGKYRKGLANALAIPEEYIVLRRLPPESASPHPAIAIQNTGPESSESKPSELGVRLEGLDPAVPLPDWQSPSDLLKPVMDPSGYWEVFDLENLTRATFGRDERTMLEVLTHKPPKAAMGRTIVGELIHRILLSYLPLEARMHMGASRTERMMIELIESGLKDFEGMTNRYPRDLIGEDITRRLALAEAKILERWKDQGLL